jgi:U6 snRNA-associated Sm-like protein LSm1
MRFLLLNDINTRRCPWGHNEKTLCSYDQFSNLVLENTVERRHLVVKGGQSGSSSSSSLDAPTAVYYSDIPLGLYVVRGESIVVMGRTNPAAVVGTSVDLKELEDLRQEQTADGGLDWDVDADLVA